MDRWKDIKFLEEGVIAEPEEVCVEELFQQTLVGKLWMGSSFNVRAF